ncbi:zeaxanthin epoxidase, chloroplastic-like isoform X2 [Diospyros lotus]|uniref:zeaxanthin epoxidase, chloroplastic-like isoform X2 n=1 Tax=Diospyros lotus TaxID=55363 RepID=UPI002256EE0F|nr:zeaxanthin epoxidase, chloroplastic-like isoform X2 [Diospyros lotus]
MSSCNCLSFSNQFLCSLRFSGFRAKKITNGSYSVRCEERGYLGLDQENDGNRKLRILVAGGGIGGLVLALAAKHRGYDVKVFERDLSAVRGEGQHRGPIQLLSSALAVLEAIDEKVARQVVQAGCVTGNRINGLADGISGDWFAKFDLLTPAVKRGLPITQVICRITLQDILVRAVGEDVVSNNSKVVDFVEESGKVKVILEDGRQYEGDVLVGADGIWSKVRSKLFGAQQANYSNYTCYSGLTHFVPPYIDTDVGSGKMQWYAFRKEAPMNDDPPGGKKEKLLELFGSWCTEVVTLISETPENMILRRDIYDRDMIYSWGVGCVTLLGDAAHPMQPNLGQGGCMAIEDCYQLIHELDKVAETFGSEFSLSNEIVSALRRYEKKRMFRVSIAHGMSRMASQMLAGYRPYMNFGFGPLSHLLSWRPMHPAIIVARILLQIFLPQYMVWMIAGHGLW